MANRVATVSGALGIEFGQEKLQVASPSSDFSSATALPDPHAETFSTAILGSANHQQYVYCTSGMPSSVLKQVQSFGT